MIIASIVGFAFASVFGGVLSAYVGERLDGRLGVVQELAAGGWPAEVRAGVQRELGEASSVTGGMLLACLGVVAWALAASEYLDVPGPEAPWFLGVGAFCTAIGLFKILRSRPTLDRCPTHVALVARAHEIVELGPTMEWSWANATRTRDAVLRQQRFLWKPFPRLIVRFGNGEAVSIAAFPRYDEQLLATVQEAIVTPVRSRHAHEERKLHAEQEATLRESIELLLRGTMAELLPFYPRATVAAARLPGVVEPPRDVFANSMFAGGELDLKSYRHV